MKGEEIKDGEIQTIRYYSHINQLYTNSCMCVMFVLFPDYLLTVVQCLVGLQLGELQPTQLSEKLNSASSGAIDEILVVINRIKSIR